MDWLKDQFNFWVSAEFFAVGVSSFFGVYIRLAIGNKFPLDSTVFGCDMNSIQSSQDDFDPFLHLYLSRHILIPNIVGCFLMAFFISHAQQLSGVSISLFKCLTTGLCGCITTFSSWVNFTVNDLLTDRWIVVFSSLMLEFWVLWSAFTMGFACSKLLHSVSKDCMKFMSKLSKTDVDLTNRLSLDSVDTSFVKEEYDNEFDQRSHIVSHRPFSSSGSIEKCSFDMSQPLPSVAVLPLSGGSKAVPSSVRSPKSIRRANTGDQLSNTQGSKHDALFFGPNNSQHIIGQEKNEAKHAESKRQKRKLLSAALSANVSSAPLNMPLGASQTIKLHHISGVIDIWREDGAGELTHDERGVGNHEQKADKTFTVVANGLENKAAPTEQDLEEGIALVKKPTVLSRTSTVMRLEKENSSNNLSQPSLFERAHKFAVDGALPWFRRNEFWVWATLFTCIALGIWISIIIYDSTSGEDLRANQPVPVSDLKLLWLRSIALGPLGAWLRWGLTKVKGIKNCWPDMNPQTIIANITAVTLACFLAVLADEWKWYLPVVYGICGSCSTVSTMIAEIHGLYFESGPVPALRYGTLVLEYLLATYVIAIAAIQIIRAGDQ